MAAASCKKRDRSEYRLMTGFPTRDVTNPGRSIFVSREAEVEASRGIKEYADFLQVLEG